MSITRQDLSEFNRYAEDKLSERRFASLQELLDEWTQWREHEQSVAAIQESVRQYEAGQCLPLKEAFDEVRQKLSRHE